MLWSRKDFRLLKQAMTNFVRSDKQVLARQAAGMYLCSSRNAGLEPEWQGTGGSSHSPSGPGSLQPLPKEPMQTSEKDNGNRTEARNKHPVISNSTNTGIYGVDTDIMLAITAGAEIRTAAT